jgi:AbiV family abortive infection protein
MSQPARFRKLNPYLGRLTPESAAAGIQAAVQNARSLLADAGILIEHNRWPRSASLAVLAIEEAGKVALIRGILVSSTPQELRDEWRAYRCHTQKSVMWVFEAYVTENPNIEDFRPLYSSENDAPGILDAIKQLGFYSDCLGTAHWSIPDSAVDERLALQLRHTAQALVPQGDSAMSTAAELHLWVKHLKPVWRKEMLLMKQALIACYQEAADLGVLRGTQSPEDMLRFLL